MKVYRVFSPESTNSIFPSEVVKSVIVIASNENEAKDIVEKKYGKDFGCEAYRRKIEIVCENIESPAIVAVDYFSDSY